MHRIFQNNVVKRYMPGKYVRSYIKVFHIRENWHYSFDATLQLILREPCWWPTIAKDLLLFITLCTGCRGKRDELAPKEGSHEPTTSEGAIPYEKTLNDWRTPIIKYLTQGEIKVGTLTRREHKEIIRRSKFFTMEKKNSRD
jgi:hypothetical protein